MKAGVHIEGPRAPKPAALEAAAEAIAQILEVASQHHVEQETIRKALDVFSELAPRQSASISNCTIGGH